MAAAIASVKTRHCARLAYAWERTRADDLPTVRSPARASPRALSTRSLATQPFRARPTRAALAASRPARRPSAPIVRNAAESARGATTPLVRAARATFPRARSIMSAAWESATRRVGFAAGHSARLVVPLLDRNAVDRRVFRKTKCNVLTVYAVCQQTQLDAPWILIVAVRAFVQMAYAQPRPRVPYDRTIPTHLGMCE